MAYTRIDITVKQPSKKLEAFVREMGGRKNVHLETLRDNAPEADLARAITVDDVIDRVREGLNEMFARKEAERSA